MVVLHHQTKTLKRFYLFIYFLCGSGSGSGSGVDKTQILAY